MGLLSLRALLGLISSKVLDIQMGRSFESMRQGVKDVSARWLKASRALKKEDQIYGQRLAEMAKKHSSEASMRSMILWRLLFSRCWWRCLRSVLWTLRRTRSKRRVKHMRKFNLHTKNLFH